MDADSWADLELLERILRAGTLSGAARALGRDQTTVARRLAALEARFGATLFDRIDGRLVPTPVLAPLRDRLRLIAEEAALSLADLRRARAELQGEVRVTSVGFVFEHILAPALAEFDQTCIALDFLAENQSLSFARREADLALRLGPAAEDGARIRRLGTIRFCLFQPAGAAPGGPVLRYGAGLAHLPEMRALDRCRPSARVALRSDQLHVLLQASLALGAELMLPEPIARADPRFTIAPEPVAERPIYLLTHPDRARVPSVLRAAGWIETAVRRWLALPETRVNQG